MRASDSAAAWASVRVCRVVRSPARASSTAIAVPKEPAPITTARRAPGSEAWARLSTAGRADAVGSGPGSVFTRASVAGAPRSRRSAGAAGGRSRRD